LKPNACHLPPSALHERDEDNHNALHRRVQIHADDAGQIQNVGDHRKQDRADHRADHTPFATLERRAAYHHRCDRFQFPKQAGGRRGGTEPRYIQHRRHADADAEQYVRDDLHGIDANRRIARDLFVRPDCLHVAAERSAIEDQRTARRDNQEHPDRHRQRAAIREPRQHRAKNAQRAQRDDERLNASFGDQQPVRAAEQTAEHQREHDAEGEDQQGCQRMTADTGGKSVHQPDHAARDQRRHRPDRQIDAARDNHKASRNRG
ncbi:hypothetical protein KCU90_g4459, partial [Aureobasidium melanogenum]